MSNTLAIAERNVPRYTSYPTAPHFSAKMGPDTYAAWLAALPAVTGKVEFQASGGAWKSLIAARSS